MVGVDDTELPKPHPHPALLALHRLSVDPVAAVMVGDTVYDMGTAQAVPMREIAVTYGVGTKPASQATNPDGRAADFGSVIDFDPRPDPAERKAALMTDTHAGPASVTVPSSRVDGLLPGNNTYGIRIFRDPRVQVVTSFIDDSLTEQTLMRPCIGDFGDRYYGTTC